MNNRKITVSLLTIATLFSINTFAQTSNKDVSTAEKNDNTRQQSVQEIINEELNAELPNTDSSTALAPNVASRQAKNEDGTDWGEGDNQTFIPYKVENTETGNKKTANCVWDATNNACNTASGTTINEQDKITVPSDSETSGGFYVPSSEVEADQGTGEYKEYFYRYWITNPKDKECADGLNSCWSASYPIICIPGVSSAFYTSLKNKEFKSSDVRDYFGVRDFSEALIYNGYQIDDKSNIDGEKNVEYRMKVKVSAGDIYSGTNGISSGSTTVNVYGSPDSGERSLKVSKWTIDPVNHCLIPDFNITELSVDGYTQTNVINSSGNLKNTRGLDTGSDVNEKYTDNAKNASSQQILPCGMFEDGNNYDKGTYFKDNMSDVAGFDCAKETDAWVTKGVGETTDSQYWTRYKIDLPSTDGTYATSDATNQKYLNVRGCAMCESATSHCRQIIKGVIESGAVAGCSCVDRDNNNGPCIYDKTVKYTDEGEEKERVVHVIASNRYYNCTSAGLTDLINKLTSDSKFELSGESGVYNNNLTCQVCLNTLEADLRAILIDHQ